MVTEPPSVVAFWFALEDTDEENAWLICPSWRSSKRIAWSLRRVGDGGDSKFEVIKPTDWPEERFIPVTVQRNSLVLMHALLPHASPVNRSLRTRESYVLHIIDGACHYPSDNWFVVAPNYPCGDFEKRVATTANFLSTPKEMAAGL